MHAIANRKVCGFKSHTNLICCFRLVVRTSVLHTENASSILASSSMLISLTAPILGALIVLGFGRLFGRRGGVLITIVGLGLSFVYS